MLGSEFVREFARKGPAAWEGAALALAAQGGLVPWPTFDLDLKDADGHTAVLTIRSDVLAVGTLEDSLRLPLSPRTAQSILNLTGDLLPTPKIAYEIWRASPFKLVPTSMSPNRYQDLVQFSEHDAIIADQLLTAGRAIGQPAAGMGKHVVVSSLMKPGRVVIFGWYRPSPPARDVFDDGRPMGTPGRQPIQPHSNVHAEDYWDYSHLVQAVSGACVVDGRAMRTEDLYRHPTLSKLVSHDGPVRIPRYPSRIPVRGAPSSDARAVAISLNERVPDRPTISDLGFDMITTKGTGT